MLKEIFNAITPDNVKTDPLYAQAIDLFINALEEHSKYAINLNDVFTSDDPEIRIQFIKTFFESFYQILNSVDSSLSDMILPNIDQVLSNEYLYMSKFFKESKGTPRAIGYIYYLIERLLAAYLDPDRAPFKFTDKGVPFYFEVEGGLSREIYDLFVRPLAHPLGFAYIYTCVIKFDLIDYFNIDWIYTVSDLKVKCPSGQEFLFDGYTVATIDDSQLEQVRYPDRYVYFTDGSYLKQSMLPYMKVVHYTINNDILKEYPDGCFLNIVYSKELVLKTKDNLIFQMDFGFDEEFFDPLTSDCEIIGNPIINYFKICAGIKGPREYLEIHSEIDFRRNWNYFKRYTEPLLPGDAIVSPEIWDEVYGKKCWKNEPWRKLPSLDVISKLENCSNNFKIGDGLKISTFLIGKGTVGDALIISKFLIGDVTEPVIDYNVNSWEHIRGSIFGDVPVIGQGSTVAHLVIGGWDKLTELPPVFEDRVVRKQPEFTTDLFDIQEFTTERFDIQDWITFLENMDEPIETTVFETAKIIPESFYDDSDEPAKVADENLVLSFFNIGGVRTRPILESFSIETF